MLLVWSWPGLCGCINWQRHTPTHQDGSHFGAASPSGHASRGPLPSSLLRLLFSPFELSVISLLHLAVIRGPCLPSMPRIPLPVTAIKHSRLAGGSAPASPFLPSPWIRSISALTSSTSPSSHHPPTCETSFHLRHCSLLLSPSPFLSRIAPWVGLDCSTSHRISRFAADSLFTTLPTFFLFFVFGLSKFPASG
ncbi:uncharacterized protein B0T15DRAFT_274248 [Chaetomium strumarium]|uniref:Uncharacterized protein n=1 Tax=Chaetomium strumarium TaxID=1170767 RepID=A0AAJ0GNZ6_9PEZI|nr:hypothetical protein B0T15DRAFT_274248 [Chaetomium strumarium]